MTAEARGLILLAVALPAIGCASPAAPGGTSAPPGPAQPTTLVMVVNTEVLNLWPKAVGPVNPNRTTRVFNATLTLSDAQDNVRPYLAESLPQLNTDTWQVFPDGRMETTWKLRPGLSWHDGQPLTGEDFVFGSQVYKAPDLVGSFGPRPQDIIERLVAIDPQTIRIYWRSPFFHMGEGLDPLARAHLSEPFAAFERDPIGQRDAFMSLRFWTTEYVGAGPYRLTNWEPASYLEGEAFGGHVLGRPKIDRVVVRFINNENTALANIMAGQVQMIMTDVIGIEQATTLRQQGGFNEAERKGRLIPTSTAVITVEPQHRLEYQQTPALHDLRVRQALAYATDRDAINEGLYSGQGSIPDTLARRDVPFYPEIDRVITKYPYDPTRAEQLMTAAGFSRDRDGFFVDTTSQRFQPALWNPPRAQQEQLIGIIVNTWQRAGIDVQPFAMPAALARDQETNGTFPGILAAGISLGESRVLGSLSSEQIGTPANRWNGTNLGGWSNPDYDLLWNRYSTTLVRAEQIQALVQMMKLQTEQVPKFPLYYLLSLVAHLSALKGPEGDSNHWNIYEWELISST